MERRMTPCGRIGIDVHHSGAMMRKPMLAGALAGIAAVWSGAVLAVGPDWRPPQSVRAIDVPRDPRAAEDALRFGVSSGVTFQRSQGERASYGARDARRLPSDDSLQTRLDDRARFTAGARDTVPTMSRDEAAADRSAVARPDLRARALDDVARFAR
jgi:hypothetical protein